MNHVVHRQRAVVLRNFAYRSSGGDTHILKLTKADRSTGGLSRKLP